MKQRIEKFENNHAVLAVAIPFTGFLTVVAAFAWAFLLLSVKYLDFLIYIRQYPQLSMPFTAVAISVTTVILGLLFWIKSIKQKAK